jgi:hypothetical protein
VDNGRENVVSSATIAIASTPAATPPTNPVVASTTAQKAATATTPAQAAIAPANTGVTPNPAPATVTASDTLPQDIDEGGEIPEFPLWDSAFRELQADPKTKETVTEYQKLLEAQAARIPEQTSSADASQPQKFSKVIKLGMDDIAAKMWKIDLSPERSIVVREQINCILKTVKKFSGVAAMAASFDPVHAGVAWAGVSAILPVSLI